MTSSQSYSLPSQPSQSSSPTPVGGMMRQSLGQPAAPAPSSMERPSFEARDRKAGEVCYAYVNGNRVVVDCDQLER